MSTALRTASRGKLFSDTNLILALGFISSLLGKRPFGVRLTVMKGLGLRKIIC